MNAPECRSLTHYLREIDTFKQYSSTEINKLFQALETDTTAREKIVQSNLRLVVWQARKLANCGLPMADLIAEGNCGLMQAIEKYDPSMSRFSTYAVFWIQQKMRRAIHSQVGSIREPEHIQIHRYKINTYVEKRIGETGVRPCEEDIAEAAKISLTVLRRIQKGMYREISLDSPISTDGKMFAEVVSDPQAATPSESMQQTTLADVVNEILSRTLDEREREVIRLRHGIGGREQLTLDQVRLNFGVTRERIRQVQAKALGKIREALKKPEFQKLRDEFQRDYGMEFNHA